jgi:hypothetical protein
MRQDRGLTRWFGFPSKFNANNPTILDRYELEMAARQGLEMKLNDLNEKLAFSKKIYEQEIEGYKAQLNIAKNTITDLGLKNFDFSVTYGISGSVFTS